MQTGNRLRKKLAILVIFLISGFIILSVILHITNPGVNALRFSLSRYGITPNGYLLSTGLFMIGLAEIIVGILLYSEESAGYKWLTILLSFMGVTAFITGIIPMDTETERTITGTIHIYAAGVQFLLFPVSSLIYGLQKGNIKSRIYSKYTGILAIVILPFITLTVLTENPTLLPFYGLLQKIYISLILLWLAVIANTKRINVD